MIKEFDKVRLTSGNIGYVVDVLDDRHFYVDVSHPAGEISTVFVNIEDIASVFEETERTLARSA
jgi:preprotein translocase subunit YajC